MNNEIIKLSKISKKYEIYGKNFDASKLISEILHDDNKDGLSFFKDLNSIFNIKPELQSKSKEIRYSKKDEFN